MIVLGIDPGGAHTGIVVIDSQATGDAGLLAHTTIDCHDRPRSHIDRPYLGAIIEWASDACWEYGVHLVAVEGVTRPKGHAAGRAGHLIDPTGLIGTAQVLGAILGQTWPGPLVVIPPGGNGTSLPLNGYPTTIRGTRAGQDNRRHARSAYDVAFQGQPYLRLQRATQ